MIRERVEDLERKRDEREVYLQWNQEIGLKKEKGAQNRNEVGKWLNIEKHREESL